MNSSTLQGALLALLSFTVFACGDAFIKLAGLDGVPVTIIVILSGAFAGLTTFLYAAGKNNLSKLRPKSWKPHAVLTTIFIAQSYVSVIAFTNLPMTTVYVGLFASPFILALIGKFFMGEALSPKQVIAIIVGFAGVLIALIPEFLAASNQEIGDPMKGYIALPLFMMTYISGMLLLRVMGRTETPESITLISMLGRAVLLLPVLFFIPSTSLSLEAVAYIAGMGITAGGGFILMSRAYQLAPVAIVSPLHYSQLIVGALLGYLIWADVPSLWIVGGGVIITLSGIMITHEAHKMGKVEPEL